MLGHDAGVGAQALVMKGRLREPALPAVGLTFAVEEALAEKLFGNVAPPTFDKLPVVGHQDVPDMIGMGDQDGRLRAQPECSDIAAGPVGVL
jgi:hypothetical protein